MRIYRFPPKFKKYHRNRLFRFNYKQLRSSNSCIRITYNVEDSMGRKIAGFKVTKETYNPSRTSGWEINDTNDRELYFYNKQEALITISKKGYVGSSHFFNFGKYDLNVTFILIKK